MSVTPRTELPVPGEGRLEGIPVPELIASLGRAGWSGSLVLERDGVRKVLYFREGRLVFSASTDPDDRLGAHLLRQGETSLADLVEASGEVARGRRLGQILVERGAMDARALTRAVLEQVREIALSVFAWERGSFRVSRARLPEEESITLDLPWEELVLEGIRRVADWDRVRRAVGGPGATWRLAPDVEAAEPPGAGRVERSLLAALRNPRRVATLAREVYAPALEVYRSLWGLGLLGLAVRLPLEEIPPALLDVGEGLIDEEGPVRLLLGLADRGVDAAVTFRDGDREVVLHLLRGRVVHAWRPFEPAAFLDWLLARGFLSDRDHARALSRAAAGGSFRDELLRRERITAEELGFLFPEFSREVAREVLLWRRGEIAIAEGEPVPEVPLFDATIEDLVVEAYETSAAFENVWRALGSLDTLFRLRPEYLDRMDRMTLRPVLWEIVSLLGQERTLAEILAARDEPDALLLRLLRAMELVGIVERVPRAELVAWLRERLAPPEPAPAPEPGEAAPPAEARLPAAEPAPEPGPAPEPEPAGEPARDVPIEAPSSAWEIAPELFGERKKEEAPPPAPPPTPSADPARTLEVPRELVERALAGEEPVPPGPGEPPAPPPEEPPPTEPVGEEPPPGAALEGEPPPEPVQEREEEPASEEAAPAPTPTVEEPPPSEPVAETPPGPPAPPEDAEVPAPAGEAIAEPASPAIEEEPPPTEPVTEAPPGPPVAAEEEEGAPGHGEEEVGPAPAPPAAEEPPPAEPVEEASPETPSAPEDDALAAPAEREEEVPPPAEEPPPAGPVAEEAPPEPAAPAEEPAREEAAASAEESAAGEPVTEEAPAAPGEPPVGEAPAEPAAEPTPELLAEVDRFLARHRVVWRALRLEIGAGVRNFVLTCQRNLAVAGDLFEGLEPGGEGDYDRDELARRLAARPSIDPRAALDDLVETEIRMIRGLVHPASLQEIEKGLAAIP